MKKRIVGDDEEEGREGTPLLDPPKNVNPVRQLTPKKGSNLNGREGAFNKLPEPRGETDLIQNMTDPLMIDRVKSFSGVEKEEDPVELLGNGCIKKVVNGLNVVTAIFACQEPLLGGVDVSINSRHDAAGNRRSKYAIVSVGNTQRPRVRDQPSVLLREKEEEAVVEPRRGEVALGNGLKDMEKDWSSKVRGSPPGSKRNTIGAGGGVIPAVNDRTKKAEVGFSAKGVVEPLVIAPQKLNPIPFSNKGGPVPNLGPINFGKSGFLSLGESGSVPGGQPERGNLGP
jgi:hypothetical protein